MRLFVASELPKESSNYLRQIQEELKALPAKQSFPKSFHITYQFLGELNPQEFEAVKLSLSALKFQKIICKLTKIGFFPNDKRIRVIWIGVEPEEQLVQLSQKIQELTGLKMDKPFKAHITLSRVKFVKDKEFNDKILEISIKEMTFTIDKVKLVESILTSEGSKYNIKLNVGSSE
ncbi:RNA 2',3'-cyclic phosphodiesterase [Nanoarchaeota archaeon]